LSTCLGDTLLNVIFFYGKSFQITWPTDLLHWPQISKNQILKFCEAVGQNIHIKLFKCSRPVQFLQALNIYLVRLQSFGMWCHTGTAQSQSLWTSTFGEVSLATHFSPTVLTCCNWFQQIRMRPCGWWFCFPNSLMIVQTTIRSDKMFHYVKLAAFVLYGMRIYFSNTMHFMLP
jgi:hypothetical protein